MDSTLIILILIGLAAAAYIFFKVRRSVKKAECSSCCDSCNKNCETGRK